jgi:hypothetical protein
MVMITISPDGLAALDKARGKTPRGRFVEQLIARGWQWR